MTAGGHDGRPPGAVSGVSDARDPYDPPGGPGGELTEATRRGGEPVGEEDGHLPGDPPTDPTPRVTSFATAAEWTGVRDRRFPGDPPDPRWLDMRRTMCTASEVAALLDVDPRRSAMSVYAEKLTARAAPEVIGLDDRRFWGTLFEQPMLQGVARFHGWGYRRGGYLLRSRAYPHLGATLDAEVDRGLGWKPYEGKTTEIVKGWDPKKQDLPMHVLVQCQVQLIITGSDEDVAFALLQGCRPCQIDVPASKDLHDLIIEVTLDFMRRLRELDPPPLSEHVNSDAAALKRLFPLEDGSVVALPPEAVEWTREIQELNAWGRAIEKRKKQLQNMLKAKMGRATWGLLPEAVGGKTSWRWETQEREEQVRPAHRTRTLIALKNPPENAPKYLAAPPATDTLLEELSASVEPEESTEDAKVIRIGNPRKRRR